MEVRESDILIIGAGIAGLSFALKMADKNPDLQIDIVAKGSLTLSNTQLAQGGIAAAFYSERDSPQQHYQDTLIASQHTSNLCIASEVVQHAPMAIQELISWGVGFDRDKQGKFHLGIEGAHSQHRILHNKDQTGKEIIEKLSQRSLEYSNIRIHPYHQALDLIISNDDENYSIGKKECEGAFLLDLRFSQLKVISAPITYLATGGAGQVFARTTNASVATGDGTAIALRAGLSLKKMGYYQFHPTVLYKDRGASSFLISEALRGAGATLKNHRGETFMKRYHFLEDLAPRDLTCAAIQEEIKNSTYDHVFLDATRMSQESWGTHFLGIYKQCLSEGINPGEDWIPVLPAAHYQCGGIPVNQQGETKIKGLYAGGECAFSGLHGNNRLASNSLLEGIVLADWSANWLKSFSHKKKRRPNYFIITHQGPSNDWVDTQKMLLQHKMEACFQADCTISFLEETLKTIIHLLKTWKVWQDNTYVFNKDFQELGSLLYNGKTILEDRLENQENIQIQPSGNKIAVS